MALGFLQIQAMAGDRQTSASLGQRSVVTRSSSRAGRTEVTRKIQDLGKSAGLPFHDILDPAMIEAALDAEGVTFNESLYTPMTTLCLFLSQVLDPDHSCRAAVARLVLRAAIRGRKPCSAETGTYCDARRRLPLGVVMRVVRRGALEIEGEAADGWLWKGRPVVMVDGTTVSMPDTPENQEAFPQMRAQEPGLGFPLVRIVAIIALATGVARDLASGPYSGRETGETALFRMLWDGLRAGEVVLGDRSFASFFEIGDRLGGQVVGIDLVGPQLERDPQAFEETDGVGLGGRHWQALISRTIARTTPLSLDCGRAGGGVPGHRSRPLIPSPAPA